MMSDSLLNMIIVDTSNVPLVSSATQKADLVTN
jgi:hypothetical protein